MIIPVKGASGLLFLYKKNRVTEKSLYFLMGHFVTAPFCCICIPQNVEKMFLGEYYREQMRELDALFEILDRALQQFLCEFPFVRWFLMFQLILDGPHLSHFQQAGQV